MGAMRALAARDVGNKALYVLLDLCCVLGTWVRMSEALYVKSSVLIYFFGRHVASGDHLASTHTVPITRFLIT